MHYLRVLMCLLVLVTAGQSAAVDLSDWQFKAQLIIEDFNQMYYSLELPPVVYDKAKPGLADLRLITADGSQTAYVKATPGDLKEKIKYEPRIINRATTESGASVITLDFERQTTKNLIEIVTDGNNFRRAVLVEGSNDNITFFTLVKEAFVFAAGYEKIHRFEEIYLPLNDYRYLRIAVRPMLSENAPPEIKAARAFKTQEKLAPRTSVEMKLIEQTEDTEKHLSLYSYDLGFKNLPIDRIELQIPDSEFYREIVVEGRDSSTKKVPILSEDTRERFTDVNVPWCTVARGSICRYTNTEGEKHERLFLNIPARQSSFRYLRITVKNYDDKPIIIRDAEALMIADKLIFNLNSRIAPILYFGSTSASRPIYDLQKKLMNPLEVRCSSVTLSEIKPNPLFKTQPEKLPPWTERHGWLLIVVLVLLVIVLGALAFSSFKSIRAEQQTD